MSAVLSLVSPLPSEFALGQPRQLSSQSISSLRQSIQRRLADRRWQPVFERRVGERIPLPVLMQLRPAPGWEPGADGDEIVVAGKDLSDQGIGFYHQQPVPYRRGVLTFSQGPFSQEDNVPLVVEVDLSWCRFTRLGWYESGGRLVRLVE